MRQVSTPHFKMWTRGRSGGANAYVAATYSAGASLEGGGGTMTKPTVTATDRLENVLDVVELGGARGYCASSVAMEPCARKAKSISPRGSRSTPLSRVCVDVRRSIFWRSGLDAISLSIPRRRGQYPMSLESCPRSVRLRIARSRGVARTDTTDKAARTAIAPMDALHRVYRSPHQRISQRTRLDTPEPARI